MDTICRRMAASFLGVLLTALSAWPMGGRDGGGPSQALTDVQRQEWASSLQEGVRAGLPEERLQATVAHLARAGLSPAEAAPILTPAYQAARDGLPAGAVLDKVDEGAVKGAPASELARAAEQRDKNLHRAAELVDASGYRMDSSRGAGGVVVAAALALEGGVPDTAVASALGTGRGASPGLMKATLEAGESLHLAGLDDETVAALMADCLERKLRRPEILRVVRFATERRRSGMTGAEVRSALWGGEGGGGGPGPSGTQRRGEGMGTGASGHGPGGGGPRPPGGGPR